MKLIGVKLIVRAFNADGYQKDIVWQSDKQVHMQESRVKGGERGVLICPKDFPEMSSFEVILENIYE